MRTIKLSVLKFKFLRETIEVNTFNIFTESSVVFICHHSNFIGYVLHFVCMVANLKGKRNVAFKQ